DGGSIIEAEIHLAKRPKLFRQTEPALNRFAICSQVFGAEGSGLVFVVFNAF
ncbi:hypothetical protein GOD36_24995, partial [Sinorhizobium medicae]|nr:hypothetical protein [Sinorhizobium medicae]MDX0826980.1 hypothetical protein [Sinorhizobium medicae]